MGQAAAPSRSTSRKKSVMERLNELTDFKGPEKCIDAVGLEAHATSSLDAIYDRVKQAAMLETDRPHVLREMIYICRPAGILSVPGRLWRPARQGPLRHVDEQRPNDPHGPDARQSLDR